MDNESASTAFDLNNYECFLNRYKAFIENHYKPQAQEDRIFMGMVRWGAAKKKS
jgi:hypothetical protein